jgi:HPr kinase/phosphorylase
MADEAWIHATAIAIDGRGVLMRGPSGSGKSRLACDMLFHASESGREACLIGDDRIALRREGNAVIARGHPHIHGQIEVRGHGIMVLRATERAKIDWIVEISGNGERLPDRADAETLLLDVRIPTLMVSSGTVSATALLGRMLGTPVFTPDNR